MASKKVYDVVATVGEYTNRNGETKKRYLSCGAVFENEEGHMSMKLECVPVGQAWSGWFSFYVPKDRDASEPAPVSEHSQQKANAFQPQGLDNDSDIPF